MNPKNSLQILDKLFEFVHQQEEIPKPLSFLIESRPCTILLSEEENRVVCEFDGKQFFAVDFLNSILLEACSEVSPNRSK